MFAYDRKKRADYELFISWDACVNAPGEQTVRITETRMLRLILDGPISARPPLKYGTLWWLRRQMDLACGPSNVPHSTASSKHTNHSLTASKEGEGNETLQRGSNQSSTLWRGLSEYYSALLMFITDYT